MKYIKYFCFLMVAVFIQFNAVAQSFRWAKKAGSTQADLARGITVDNNDNVYMVGRFNGTINFDSAGFTKSLVSAGQGDIYVAKLNCSRNLVWANRIGGTSNDGGSFNVMRVEYDNIGHIYVTGAFAGTTTFTTTSGSNQTLTSAGSNDIFLAKYDTFGVLQWAVKSGGTASDEGLALTIDQSGNIIVGGIFTGTAAFGTTSGASIPLISSGVGDLFIAKYSPLGVLQWVKTAVGAREDVVVNIVTDKQNNIYVSGNYGCCVGGTITFGAHSITNASGGWGAYIAKADSNGSWLWVNGLGAPGDEAGSSCAVDDSGNVFFTGHFSGNSSISSSAPGVAIPLTQIGNFDIFLARFDTAGVLIWAKVLGGTGADYAYSMTLNERNNIVIAGGFSGTANFSGFNLTSSGGSDVYVCEYTKDGTVVGGLRAGGAGDDIAAFSMASDSKGALYIVGEFMGNANFGATTLSSSGGTESFVAKISPGLSFSLLLNNLPVDTVALCAADDSVAITSSIILPVNSTFSWLKDGTVLPGEENDTLVARTTGTYQLIVKNACNEADTSLPVSITVGGVIPVINTIADVGICIGDSVQLGVSGISPTASVLWAPAVGLSSTSIATPIAIPTISTDYIVTVTDSGCSAKDTVNIAVNPNCCVLASTITNHDSALLFAVPIKGNAKDIIPVSMPENVQGPTTLLASDRFNNAGGAYNFADVANDRITYTAGSKLSFPQNQSFTISVWANARTLRNNNSWITSVYDWGGFEICIGGSGVNVGKLQFIDFNGPTLTTRLLLVSDIDFPLNTWNHILVSVNKNDSVNTLYLNGRKTAQGKVANSILNNCAVSIGNHTSNPWGLDGWVDDLRIYGEAFDSIEVINLYNNGRVVILNNDTSICSGDSVNLRTRGTATSYSWTPAVGLSDSTIANPVARPTVNTSYILTTTSGGCTFKDTIIISVTNIQANAGNDTTIVLGDSAQLNATGGTTYSWSPTTGLTNPNIANPKASPDTTTQYIVTVSNGSCISTDTVIVTVTNLSSCDDCNSAIPLNNGLVACYPFNGNLDDESGNGHDGTNNGVTPTTDRFGNANSAYTFGTNKTITIPTTNLTNNTYTYSTWVKITSLPTNGNAYSIIGIGGSVTGDQVILLGNNYSGQTGFTATSYRIPFNPSGPDRFSTGTLPALNTWYHVVQVRNLSDNKLKLYINGVKVGEVALTSPTAAYDVPPQGLIGARPPGNTQYFNGSIDDVRIYNRALSDNEIAQLYTLLNPITANAGNDTTIVAGDSAQLNATGGTTYLWSPTTGLSNPNIANPKASPDTTTQYIVTVSNGSCTAMDTVVVTITDTVSCDDCSLSNPLNDGLIVCYPFNGNANDKSGNNQHGSVLNATLTTDRFNTNNSAYHFNGTNASINIAYSSLFNIAADERFTIALWIQPEVMGVAGLFVKSPYAPNISNALWDYGIYLLSSGKVMGGYAHNHTVESNTTLTLNIWHHLALTYNDGIWDLYVNGQLEASDHSRTKFITQSSGGLAIGKKGEANGDYFTGKVDDIRMYNRTLSACDIYALYSGGCSFNPTVNAGTDTVICAGDSIQLTLTHNDINSYLWQPGTTLSDSTIANPYAKPSVTTDYIVTGTIGSCNVYDTVRVDVASIQADAGSDQFICLGDSVQLNAIIVGSSFRWSPTTGLSDTTVLNPYAKPVVSTQYYFIVDNGVCQRTDSVTVSITSSGSLNAGSDTAICPGDSVQLNVSGGGTYSWSPAAGLSGTAVANPKASPAVTTQYIVTSGSSTCLSTDTVVVTVSPLPVISLNDTTKCKDIPLMLNPYVLGADVYAWEPADSLNDSTLWNPLIYSNGTTQFKLTTTNTTTGCSASDSFVVTISNPKAEFTVSPQAGEAPLKITTNNISTPLPLNLLWFFEDSNVVDTSTDFNPEYTFNAIGFRTILLAVVDPYGCIDTISQMVEVTEPVNIFIPNVFTPNGDGINDIFEAKFSKAGVRIFHGSIWNRWGGKVYEFTIPGGKWWDGKDGGTDASDGVYYYIYTVTDIYNEVKIYRGTVTLLR